MRVLCLFFIMLIPFEGVYSQQTEWSPLYRMAVGDLDLISLDNQGNVFYADRLGNVFKVDPTGQISSRYSPRFQGRLTQLDASSTTVLFLFSVDLQQIVLLDRHLVPIQNISFQEESLGIIKAAALGNDHAIWLIDEGDLSLKKYNYRINEVTQVQSMATLIGGNKIEVIGMVEKENVLFMLVKDRGLFVLDNQGNVVKSYNILFHKHSWSVYSGKLYFDKEGQIFAMNIYSGEECKIALPEFPASRIAVSSQRVALASTDSLYILLPTRPPKR